MWLIVISWCASGVLVMSLAFCLCWRRKNNSNDWHGPDGMVIQKNPDENVNHLPSVTVSTVDGINTDSEIAKRSIPNTTRRSLPDIPSDQNPTSNYEPIVDNSSGHYATVGQHLSNGNALAKQGPSSGEVEKPYERVKYDQMKIKEHPYAQLQPTRGAAGTFEESESEENTNLLRIEEMTTPDVSGCSRSGRSSLHGSISNLEPESSNNILAAPAVAGVLAASPELPYMTPPVNQANFSGDSQDSSKGYTSISVREPLANIIDQTKKAEVEKRKLDPHYSTLSDDSSDDVYTTIADPKNAIYTSESETYARIESLQITVEAEINREAEMENTDELYELPPENPPNVEISRNSYSHSRQASSSSSVANVGSPKPEKRQANSPLPPPPPLLSGDAALLHSDAKSVKNLDDMYAKVHKNNANSKKEPLDDVQDQKRKSDNAETTPPENFIPQEEEHNYETLKSHKSSHRRRQPSDPAYEKIKDGASDEAGYASINGSNSSDPGYEILKDGADPNYEELRHKASNASDFSGYSKIRDLMDGYSVVEKGGKKSEESDPNYESMPTEYNNESSNNNNEIDPRYETVEQALRKAPSLAEENVWRRQPADNSDVENLNENRETEKTSAEPLVVVDENGIVQI